MKKLLSTLALTPLALSSCSSVQKGPTSINVETPQDLKQKVVSDFYNATKSLHSTQTDKWEAACNQYVESSFWAVDPSGTTLACKEYHIAVVLEGEKLGIKSGLKLWEWKDMTGSDVLGWDVKVLTKNDTQIIDEAKFEAHTKQIADSNESWTHQDVKNIFNTGFENALNYGTLSTYKIVKNGDVYKIKEINNELLRG